MYLELIAGTGGFRCQNGDLGFGVNNNGLRDLGRTSVCRGDRHRIGALLVDGDDIGVFTVAPTVTETTRCAERHTLALADNQVALRDRNGRVWSWKLGDVCGEHLLASIGVGDDDRHDASGGNYHGICL